MLGKVKCVDVSTVKVLGKVKCVDVSTVKCWVR